MRLSILACAMVALLWPLGGCDFFAPAPLSVRVPAAGDRVGAGTAIEVAWSPGSEPAAQVNVTLEQAGAEVLSIARNTANTGRVAWAVPATLPLGEGYRVVVDTGTLRAVGGAFRVAPAVAEVGISTRTLNFPVNTRRLTMQVFNDGPLGTALRFEATSNRPWLIVSPRTGQSRDARDRVTLTVEVVEARLQPGSNRGSITVRQTDGSGAVVTVETAAFRPLP